MKIKILTDCFTSKHKFAEGTTVEVEDKLATELVKLKYASEVAPKKRGGKNANA